MESYYVMTFRRIFRQPHTNKSIPIKIHFIFCFTHRVNENASSTFV